MRVIPREEEFELHQALHIAVLDALMASRRWEPGDLVFQGGAALHLAHGGPRFSEDLYFLVASSLNLDSLASALQARLERVGWFPSDMLLAVRSTREDRNPRSFMVALGGQQVIGSAKVKVELWRTPEAAVRAVSTIVAQVRAPRGPAAGATTYVPTARLAEIYADKVFAIAARPRLKARDTWDLFWLRAYTDIAAEVSPAQMRTRLDTYPNTRASAWMDSALARRQELHDARPMIQKDLRRWLPSAWPLGPAEIDSIVASSEQAIEHGIDVMRKVASETSDEREP